MLQSISWQDFLKMTSLLLVLFYAIVLAVFYSREIKHLVQGKLFKKIDAGLKNEEDVKTFTTESQKDAE